MKVLKFGGNSLKDKKIIDNVIKLIQNVKDCKIIVVSAFGDTTNHLKDIAHTALNRDDSYIEKLKKMQEYHYNIMASYSVALRNKILKNDCEQLFENLSYILRGIYLLKELTNKSLDYVLSFGELLSSKILSGIIKNSTFVNSAELIVTDSNYGNARVNKKISYPLIQKKIKSCKDIIIMGGFFGKNPNGQITTMGVGASDYTASIVAAAIGASEIQIWTDVNGFLSADPNRVNKSQTIKELSFNEALELSHFGAKVLYPPSIQPSFEKSIPILIKNTYSPENDGTRITISEQLKESSKLIKGISSIDNVVLLNLSGSFIMNSSARLFKALAEKQVNIIIISHASSEFSITLAIDAKDLPNALNTFNKEFELELSLNRLKLTVEKEFSVVAVVGENMKNKHSIAGKLFSTLGRNAINIFAIAQGASETNISFVVKQNDTSKALNAIHDRFFLSDFVELNLFLIGIGNIGRELVRQIKLQYKKLLEDNQLKINIVGMANSKRYIFDIQGVDIEDVFSEKAKKLDLNEAIKYFDKINLSNSLIVDCTAAEAVAEMYELALNAGISIVAANKIATSSSLEHYKKLKSIARKTGVKFLYETNVGAGLPIITTIRDMVKSGDQIIKLEAVLSGTLNYIFNCVNEHNSLSQAIMKAKDLGISEPDPRIDLSGNDVLRKLLILTRESGYDIEIEEILVKEFLPTYILKQNSLDSFLDAIVDYDDKFEKDRKKISAQNKKCRYVAKMEHGKAQVGLEEVAISHPFYELEGSNNIIIITTERYKEHPLIIKGYGAGKEVTAAGVFADIMRVINA